MTCFMRDLLLTGGELVDTVGFERRNRMLDASRGSRATKKDDRRQGEQADRCADPERPLEAACERDVRGLAVAGQNVEVRCGDRRCDRDADRPAELLRGVEQ